MTRPILSHTQKVLESVSFDPKLFYKELRKSIKVLLPYELEQLRDWLTQFTDQNHRLKPSLHIIDALI